jgi:nitrogenase molybdenum-cofactor synthesis protein NifE
MEAIVSADREKQVHVVGEKPFDMECGKKSAAGSVSQRACAFCGSRVVLYPIADALHLVHGPIGCAAYTWDIRGSMSSGPELHRLSFSTDLRERDVIYGGEDKLRSSLATLIAKYSPKAAFVYSTCIVGVIGDDVEAICRSASEETGIPVIPVRSEGFKGTKMDGYAAACDALATLVGTGQGPAPEGPSINLMGEFNLAGEAWTMRGYFERMGVKVIATLTGDGRVDEVRRAHLASLNVLQCSGAMSGLAKSMKEKYGLPFIRGSFFGLEDTAKVLYDVADFFKDVDPLMAERTQALVAEETARVYPRLKEYAAKLKGKKAAIYVGGAFKAFSLIKALRCLDMEVVLVGSQTGSREDYEAFSAACGPGTAIVDDSNPLELSRLAAERGIDLFIGGVKERPIAYKIGMGFCDHNHERKIPLAGFEGMLNFAKEVASSVLSPVWRFVPGRAGRKE